jgi:phage shock protein A
MVFKRLRDLTVATINEGLDQVENPVVMLNQYLRDMESEISKAESAVVKQTTVEQKFHQQFQEAQTMVEKRTRQANLALNAGEENLARKALHEKKHYTQKVEQHQKHFEEASKQVKELKQQLAEMKDKYQELRDKKYSLMARANAAKTKQQMSTTMAQFDNESAAKGFSRIEERILEMETRLNVTRTSQQHTFEGKFGKLEQDDDIEQELLQMKKNQEDNLKKSPVKETAAGE